MNVYDALEQLQRITRREDDPVPEGWYSSQQIAQARRCSNQRVHLMLMAALRAGKIERKALRVGNTRPTWFWRIPPESEHGTQDTQRY